MANSQDTKQAITAKIDRLTNQKRDLKSQVAPLKAKADRFKNRIDEITASIAKLEADLNG
jgi:peptidoglycan hydrolase CwlO-like protein